MADYTTIQRSIRRFAHCFYKDSSWENVCLPMWENSFQDTPDRYLLDAVQEVCSEEHKYKPTLGHVVAAANRLQDRAGLAKKIGIALCQDCSHRGGRAASVAHYRWIGASIADKKQGKLYISHRVGLCGCVGSRDRLAEQNLRMPEERKKLLLADDRLELIKFVRTSMSKPYLSHEDTLPEEEYKAISKRIKDRQEGRLPMTGFHRFAEFVAEISGGIK